MTARMLIALTLAALVGALIAFLAAGVGHGLLDPDIGAAGFLAALAALYATVPTIVGRSRRHA